MLYILLGIILIAIFIVPAWIILASDTHNFGYIILGLILLAISLYAPAFTILMYSKKQRTRYEARDLDFKDRLIPHNRKNFIPHDIPIKMGLFGAYFTVDMPEMKHQPTFGPLVTSGRKRLNE